MWLTLGVTVSVTELFSQRSQEFTCDVRNFVSSFTFRLESWEKRSLCVWLSPDLTVLHPHPRLGEEITVYVYPFSTCT